MNIKDLFRPLIVQRINLTDHEERAHLSLGSSQSVVVDTCFRYLALACSSSDLELDHRRLELEMKGATTVFALSRLLVLRATNWVGMGFTFCAWLCAPTCILTRVCVSLWGYLMLQLILRVRLRTDRGGLSPTQLHVRRLLTGHLLSEPSTTAYC